jgi:hypothetical protein
MNVFGASVLMTLLACCLFLLWELLAEFRRFNGIVESLEDIQQVVGEIRDHTIYDPQAEQLHALSDEMLRFLREELYELSTVVESVRRIEGQVDGIASAVYSMAPSDPDEEFIE